MRQGTVWKFKTRHFTIRLNIDEEQGYRYDGDDEDGEIQRKIDDGEYVAFTSCVSVEMNGQEIASDYLGGSVYGEDSYSEFWTSHRSPDFMNRNCSLMREAKGQNAMIGHYFPDMVRRAIADARKYISDIPTLRKA